MAPAHISKGPAMLNRRHLLMSAAALAVAPLNTAFAAETAVTALLDAFFDEDLRRHPESATSLGMDRDRYADLRFRLTDVSPKGRAEERAANADRLKRLAAFDRRSLSPADAINHETVVYVEESLKRILDFPFGGQDGFSPSPYVLSPITGAYQGVPDFLESQHRVEVASDADAYLSRLEAFATNLDANTEQFRRDVAMGVVPPDFLLDTTITQVKSLQVQPEQSGLVTSLARRARDKGLSDAYAAKAAKIYADRIAPALARQSEALTKARALATHDAGVWHVRQGPEFYAANLHYTTTTEMTPAEVHQMGLDQAREIGARLDVLLKAEGLTQGGVGERIQALYRNPKYLYPNTDTGKAEIMAYLGVRLAEMKRRMPTMFEHVPAFAIEARPVPAAIDSGAPLAYAQSPSLDGSRPGYIYFNLHDTAEWPRWNLDSTLWHEGLPGHQLQGGIALESKDIPILRRNMYFSGYGEGWALYAEQLADEMGMYDDFPLGRIGFLKAQMFRAARLVVDTGMHTMRWSREKAIETKRALDGDAIGSTMREIDRYCAIPAQACSYKIGHTVWNRLRDRAKAELGPKFDIRRFHAAGLNPGAVPLDVLDRIIADYTAAAKA
jgi:uncharacterized protein (DUF885 family)